MKRWIALFAQVVLFVVLLTAAGALWIHRDRVTQVLAGIPGATGQSKPDSRSPRIRRVPVVLAPVARRNDDFTISAIGTARAKRSVTLNAETTGEIVGFDVRAGDRVKRGQTILRLDNRKARLAVQLAVTNLTEAQRTLERWERLERRNVGSRAKVEDARTLVKRADLEMQQAQEALADHTLTAPFDGFVGIPKLEIGDRVQANTPIITLDDRSMLLVEFEAAERYLSRLQPGLTVQARTPSFPRRGFEGSISRIDSRVDPTSRTVIVRATVPNDSDLLRPGMSFNVDLVLPGQSYPSVPELALQWRKGQSYVWLVRDGAAVKVSVRTVRRLQGMILVEGELGPGDRVVVEGVQRLRPGRPVRFSEPRPTPSS